MILKRQDILYFYSLYYPMLSFVNDLTRAAPNLPSPLAAQCQGRALEDIRKVANLVWDDTSYLDRFLEAHPEFDAKQKRIVLDWKRFLRGDFILERIHTKNAIFIHMETQEIYEVKQLLDPFGEVLGMLDLPIVLNMTLLPFQDFILYDETYEVRRSFNDTGNRRYCRDLYTNARRQRKVRTFL